MTEVNLLSFRLCLGEVIRIFPSEMPKSLPCVFNVKCKPEVAQKKKVKKIKMSLEKKKAKSGYKVS